VLRSAVYRSESLKKTIENPSSTPFKFNLAATVLLPSIIPFTATFIMATNSKLFAKNDAVRSGSLENQAVDADDESIHALIHKWGRLNLARAALVGAGVFCAVWAAIDK
jgi:hypothetical protein